MSRGVKDLRELICVSRLTMRESDEEPTYSDDEGRISRFSYACFSSETSGSDSRQSSAQSLKGRSNQMSPDSGISTNGLSPESEFDGPKHVNRSSDVNSMAQHDTYQMVPHPPIIVETKKQRRKKKKGCVKVLDTLPAMHELPKAKPLPPVHSGRVSPSSTHSKEVNFEENNDDCAEKSEPIHSELSHGPRSSEKVLNGSGPSVNLDFLLTYLDATFVSEWLIQSNAQMEDMAKWCQDGDNFVQFAHFWLSEMPPLQRQEILKLEYSILMDQFQLAFAAGRDAGQIKYKDLVHFTQAVFKEYPAKLFSSKGSHIFLNYLDILISERTGDYKKLLTDVRCSTKVRQFAQWTLACRAFCVISIWNAVLKFYRTLQSQTSGRSVPLPSFAGDSDDDLNHHRMYHAIRNQYLDVIHYLVTSGKVKRDSTDLQKRTLIFTAVIQNKVKVLEFLLKKIKCDAAIVNKSADNGNTPLHAAANVGDAKMVATLLNVPGIDINPINPQCEDATPLHLAVMHGHEHVVEMLLVAKADPNVRMGDLTPLNIARDFGHDNIVHLFKEY